MNKLVVLWLALLFSLTLRAHKTGNFQEMRVADTLPTIHLISFLQQMDINSYCGRPVDSFLHAIPANLYNLKVYGGSNSQGAIFRASEMIVDFQPYGNGPRAIIYVREFNHMNRYSPTATWDVNLFRKEKICRIDVYKDQNNCINGGCMN